jgi:hypothetical protein
MKYSTIFTIMPLSLFCLNQLYPIIHCPVVNILDREKHKLLFVCGYGNIPASNRLWIFLMCVMVMMKKERNNDMKWRLYVGVSCVL